MFRFDCKSMHVVINSIGMELALNLKHFFGKDVIPILPLIEKQQLPPVGPFSQVRGTIMRSETLRTNCYGDAIWHNENAICVIDASAPGDKSQFLDEADMVRDLQNSLSDVFDSTPLTSDRLLNALNAVLTSKSRKMWRGQAEFGLSMGGIYCGAESITVFNIGTGALYINDKMEIAAQKEFHNPYPTLDSKKVEKNLSPTIKTFPLESVESVTICTDGINFKRYSPISNRPIAEFIVPRAKEATILSLER